MANGGVLARRPRIGCVVATLLAGPVVATAIAFAIALVIPSAPIEEGLARSALAREAAVAEAIGLGSEGRGTQALPLPDDFRIPIAIGPGECAAVIAASFGSFEVSKLTIEGGGQALATTPPGAGLAHHVQWCSTGEPLEARVELSNRGGIFAVGSGSGTLLYALHRGRPADGFDALTRALPTEHGARRVPREALLASADRAVAGRSPLGPAIEIASYRARLIPESAAAYAELHRLADNGRGDPVTPRYDPLPPQVPAAWRPLAPPGASTPAALLRGSLRTDPRADHPAVAWEGTTAHRVLAIVDPRALGGCVTVQLVRMLYGYEARVRRIGGGELPRHRHVATDRACGEIRAYVAPASDQATYLLRTFPG